MATKNDAGLSTPERIIRDSITERYNSLAAMFRPATFDSEQGLAMLWSNISLAIGAGRYVEAAVLIENAEIENGVSR